MKVLKSIKYFFFHNIELKKIYQLKLQLVHFELSLKQRIFWFFNSLQMYFF